VGGIWKSLEMWAREALECCKLSLRSDSGGNPDDQVLIGKQTEKMVLVRFQVE
jgi:hypothetical protein